MIYDFYETSNSVSEINSFSSKKSQYFCNESAKAELKSECFGNGFFNDMSETKNSISSDIKPFVKKSLYL